MTVPPFLDTNVLVYAHDRDEPAKREVALALLARHAADFVCSAQVLAEFYVVVTRKLAHRLDAASAAAQVGELAKGRVVAVDADLVVEAAKLSRAEQMSLWDAMVVRAAVRGGCGTLLTEDLQHGAVIDEVEVRNPFAGADET